MWNEKGFVRSALAYGLVVLSVGGFVYSAARANVDTFSTESERERLDSTVRELQWEREQRASQERGSELSEWGSEQAAQESASEWYDNERPREGRENTRETRESNRENAERDRESPDVSIGEGRRDPNNDGTTGVEEIPSASQPTSCQDQEEGELCATLNFRYERPHKSFLWYVAPELGRGHRILTVKAVNEDLSDGKKAGGLRTLIVYYADGTQDDLIQSAKDSGRFSNRTSQSGVLFLKKGDEFELWLKYAKDIEAISLTADSWRKDKKPVQLEFRWQGEGDN